jgi:BirA family biotin operon repressor/biotin-[acetyl-CoA-carboxylase] ligase
LPLDLEWVRARLPERRIEWRNTIDSTMHEAGRLAEAGCASGTTAGAEEQTAGHGRYGRHWHSEPEAGLYFSVVLRYPFPPDTLPVVTLALGLAVSEAILKASDVVCDLRWPNDVLIQSKKCAGILPQFDGSAIVAGIGINVNHAAFPEDLAAIATSLRIASGRPQSRERLLVEVLPAIDSFLAMLQREGKDPIIELFSRASSYAIGRRVQVDQGDCTITGTTAGLTPAGFLTVRDSAGKQHVIIAGGVRACS